MTENTWSFGTVTGGNVKGFKDSGIHLFGNNTFESMIREGIQNSIDAQDASSEGPVHVSFTIDEFNPQTQSELEGLVSYLEAGQKQEEASNENSEASKWYRESVKKIRNGSSIKVLGVHDANTVGLTGTTDETSEVVSPWIALVKGQGINVKRSTDSLGGFGHGSNAAFGMSNLRTVFYLSPSLDELEKPVTRFQGHSILQTLNMNGVKTNSDGFFGIAPSEPLLNSDVPQWFLDIRENTVGPGKGTSVFIVDPRDYLVEDFWQALQTCAIANFAYAILKGRLEVSFDNGAKVDSSNVTEIFDELTSEAGDHYFGLSEAIAESLQSATTVLHPTLSSEHSESVPTFGQDDWFIRLGDEVKGKHVGIARDPGMLITREAQQLRQFQGYSDFDLFVCVRSGTIDEHTGIMRGGARIIKAMEDPSHTKLHFDWVSDSERAEFKTSYGKFAASVRDLVREHASPVFADVIDIDVEDLLGDDPLGEKLETEGFDVVVLKPGRKKRPTPLRIAQGSGTPGEAQVPEGVGGQGGPGGQGGNPPENPGGGVPGQVTYEKAPLRSLRVVHLSDTPDGWSTVRVVLTAEKAGHRRIALFAAGETDRLPISIKASDSKDPQPAEVIDLVGTETGRVEQLVLVPTAVLRYALSGEIHYGIQG